MKYCHAISMLAWAGIGIILYLVAVVISAVLIIYEWQNVIYFGRSMLLPVKWQVEIHPKFGVYLQDLRLILTKRLLYLIGFAANTGNSSSFHTFNESLLYSFLCYSLGITICGFRLSNLLNQSDFRNRTTAWYSKIFFSFKLNILVNLWFLFSPFLSSFTIAQHLLLCCCSCRNFAMDIVII